jgi:hypothetical protein
VVIVAPIVADSVAPDATAGFFPVVYPVIAHAGKLPKKTAIM